MQHLSKMTAALGWSVIGTCLTACSWLYQPGPFPPSRPQPPVLDNPDVPNAAPVKSVGIVDAIVVERFECLAGGEARGWFYEGVATIKGSPAQPEKIASVALDQRYAARFRSGLTGVDSSDWWCIPRKRICYSQVDFDSWGGVHEQGATAKFDRLNVYSAERHTLPTVMETKYGEQCK